MTRHFFVSLRNIFFTSFIRYLLRQTQNEFFIFPFLSDSLIISFRDIFQLSFLSEKKILSLSLKNQVLRHSLRSLPSTFFVSSLCSEISSSLRSSEIIFTIARTKVFN